MKTPHKMRLVRVVIETHAGSFIEQRLRTNRTAMHIAVTTINTQPLAKRVEVEDIR